MSLAALIFDVDGTLAETEEVHRDSFNRAFADAGMDWHWGEILYGRLLRVAGGKERIAHYAGSIGETIDPGAIVRLHRIKTDHYVRAIAENAELRPGVAAVIDGARARGIRLAIATTTTRANVDGLLARTCGGTQDFEAIVAGDAVAHKKPAPDVYLAVLEQMRLPASACLAIEDSPDGLASARAAGIATLVTPSHYMAGGDFSAAWRVMPDLASLGDDPLAALASAFDKAGVEVPGRIAEPR